MRDESGWARVAGEGGSSAKDHVTRSPRAGSNFEPKYRFERCEKVKGICKTFCDDDEYDYGYCIKWRNQCCI
ncbi:beta-defensin 110-like [Phyllostomus hastatus]|uniref:beta-defensin 110-like n=1 Tax=Phyllostomus hastatus TaxID=9423 RepID=UPI001E68418C|nr:beta-defensin 110-like [Phyllostomus hastatus]